MGNGFRHHCRLGNGGLGVRSAMMLAPSAFLASAASTLQLQQSILPEGIKRLSIALQRGNAVSFLSTFTATD